MSSNLNFVESVIQKLLTPDTDTIKQATKQLLEYFLSDKCILGLFELLNTSRNPQHKICAATLLRKKVKGWKTFSDNEKSFLKVELMNLLTKETDEQVKKQIMWLISATYKFIVKSKQDWPELLKYINDSILAVMPDQHLLGVYFLSILNEEAAEQMKPHYINILKLFSNILSNEASNLKSCFYIISSLKCMIPFVNDDENNDLSNLLPHALTTSIKIIKSDQKEDTIVTIFDFFQSLVEYDIPIVTTYIKHITEIVLEKFILDATLLNPTRVCAMSLLNVMIETQKNHLVKHEMIRPIVNSMFLIMCQSNHPLQIKTDSEMEILDSDQEDDKYVEDNENLFTSATQVMDYCALYFPPKKFIKILIEYVSPAITSEDPLHRRAALAALAITSEGCSDFYRNHYLELLTDLCLKGMQDLNIQVVQISYFALCQFSEYLQPNLSQFAKRIMHILFDSIESKIELRQISRLTVRFFEALESFCENLGDDLMPYVPTLMSKLMTLEVQCSSCLKMKRLIISTFTSIVCSIKNEYTPYFDYTVQLMKPYLLHNQLETQPNDTKLLQIECIDLMGVFAKHINKDKFNDVIIENCLTFAQNVLSNDKDPEIRSGAYDLLAGLSCKLKEKMPLKSIIPQLIETLKSEEGINLVDSSGAKKETFSAFDEIDLTMENDEEDDEDEDFLDDDEEEDETGTNGDKVIDDNDYLYSPSDRLAIDNEYVAEKLSAIYCLVEISKYLNPELHAFYNDLFVETKTLTNFLHSDVRKEAFFAMACLISYYHDFCVANLNNNAMIANESQKDQILMTFNTNFRDFQSKSLKTIKKESNRQLVMGIFDSIRTILINCAPFIKQNFNQFAKLLESYGNSIIDTFQHKIYCQVISKEEEYEDDEAECYKMLKEYAGDVIPALGLCLPEPMFDCYFEKVSSHLVRILKKPESTTAEKSFVIGVVGETIGNMEFVRPQRAQQLFAEFYQYLHSTDDEIRSNTIYTIGILFYQSQSALKQYYQQTLSDMVGLLQKEKHKQSLDNICAFFCRMCMCCLKNGIEGIDYESIIKTIFVDLTPLKVDFNEYFTLYTFIIQMLPTKLLINYYQRIVELSGHILLHSQEDSKKGTRDLIVHFLNYLNQNYKQEFDMLMSQLKEDFAREILRVLTNS